MDIVQPLGSDMNWWSIRLIHIITVSGQGILMLAQFFLSLFSPRIPKSTPFSRLAFLST